MVAIATGTFATSMQPYPSQPHLPRGTHSFHRTITHGESRRISTGPPQTAFPTFYYRSSSFCCLNIFFHYSPPNDRQKINNISIDSEMPPHRLFLCFKENSLFFWRYPIFPPQSNTLPHSKGICSFNIDPDVSL